MIGCFIHALEYKQYKNNVRPLNFNSLDFFRGLISICLSIAKSVFMFLFVYLLKRKGEQFEPASNLIELVDAHLSILL
ncbi:unnamed protein product [Rotaria socialis]